MSKVTVFSSPTCGQCRVLKKYLDSKGVNYVVKDITTPEYKDELLALGYSTIPVTVVDGDPTEVIVGVNVKQLESAIANTQK